MKTTPLARWLLVATFTVIAWSLPLSVQEINGLARAKPLPDTLQNVQAERHEENKSTYRRVVSIDDRLANVESDVSKLSDRIYAQYTDIFSKLAQIGIGAFAIAVALAAFIGNMWIKDRVNALHDDEIKRAREKLSEMLETGTADIGANIYSTIGAYCLDLYRDFDQPFPGGRHEGFYNSYLGMAAGVAEAAQDYARSLRKSLDRQKDQKNTFLTAEQRASYDAVIINALNNYVFYLSQRGRESDKRNVSNALPELIKIVSEKRDAQAGEWWRLHDTITWAKLHLGRITPQVAAAEVQALLNDRDIDDDSWKNDVRKQYALYNKFHAEVDRVILT